MGYLGSDRINILSIGNTHWTGAPKRFNIKNGFELRVSPPGTLLIPICSVLFYIHITFIYLLETLQFKIYTCQFVFFLYHASLEEPQLNVLFSCKSYLRVCTAIRSTCGFVFCLLNTWPAIQKQPYNKEHYVRPFNFH